MKCLNGFSSSSSGMFSMDLSTEEHLERFLDWPDSFLVAMLLTDSPTCRLIDRKLVARRSGRFI